jgi:hypothetical protein
MRLNFLFPGYIALWLAVFILTWGFFGLPVAVLVTLIFALGTGAL